MYQAQFSPFRLRKKLCRFLDSKESVELEDCEIKKPRRGENLEVLLKSATKIDKSCKQFNIPDVEFQDRPIPDILLEALEEIDVYQLVNVKVKVLHDLY